MSLSANTSNALSTKLGLSPGAELATILDFTDGPTNRWFVDSVNGSNTFSGDSWRNALATIDAAVNKAAANDWILIAPGHVDSLASGETIDFDVAGLKVIGLGSGASRPRIDYDATNASIDIGADGVHLENITLRPSVAVVDIGIDIEAGATDTTLKNIEILPGEAGDGTDEFVIGVDIKAGCDRTVIDGMKYSHHASCDGAASCIKLTGASDRVSITNCWLQITGTAAVACINGDTTLSTRVLVQDCVLTTDAEPGIELLTGTTGVFNRVAIFADLATIDAAIVADGCACFDCKYVEVGNEAGTLIKTESVDD